MGKNKLVVTRIDLLLEMKGETVFQLCRNTGVNKSKFSMWKYGKSNLYKDEFEKIANYLGTTMDCLSTGTGFGEAIQRAFYSKIAEDSLLYHSLKKKHNQLRKEFFNLNRKGKK